MKSRIAKTLLYFALFIFGAVSAPAATCSVNALTDSGSGSGGASGTGDLRYCITQTNANAGADTINITLIGTVLLNSNLPYISGSLTINGSNQTAFIIDAQNGENRRGFEIDAPAGVIVTIRNMTIRNGNITSSGIGSGGGVSLISGASLSLESVNIINNTSVDGGAGVYVNGSNLNIQNSRITGNNSTSFGAGGGAINFFNGTLLMTGTNVSGNTASNGGAVAFAFVSLARIENSSITGNTAVRGGGIYNAASTLRMSNVTVSGNTASELGGGFVNASNNGNVTLRNCTIAGNTAINSGGGFYNFGGSNITTTIANTIVADNSATNGADILNSFSSVLLREGANIIETEIVGSGGVGGGGSSSQVDPMLFPLDTNGSSTTLSHNFAPNSPARNAGVNGEALNTLSAPLTNDQRGIGYSRVAGSSVDIGAYEFISSLVTKTADTNDGVCDADCSLREAVSAAIPGTNIELSTLFDTPQTITLGSLISITKSLTLIGSGADKLTISGGNATSLFENFTGSTASINFIGMTFADGNGTGGSNNNQGGALEIHGTSVSFDRTVFRNNNASTLGGALMCFATTCRITNSTFTNNSAPLAAVFYGGGGITQIINTTISGNGVNGSGYGAFYLRGNVFIRNSTFADNLGFSNIYLSSEAVNIYMANTIVAGSATNDIYRVGGTVTSSGGNLIGRNSNAGTTFSSNGTPNVNGDFVGTSGSPINPLLTPLGNYGGTTPTRVLLPNSIALNNGTNCVVNNSCSPVLGFSLIADQRGAARQIGTAVDIGAVESSISINPELLPSANLGVNYNQQLSAVRETNFAEISKIFGLRNFAPTQFEIVSVSGQSLPPGLVLSPSGLLSGIPTVAGIYTFTVKAVDTDTIAGARTFSVQVLAATASNVSISGRILTADGRNLSGAVVKLTDQNGVSRTVRSSSFGIFRFDDIEAGQTYILSATSKFGRFTPQIISVFGNVTDLVLTANDNSNSKQQNAKSYK